MEKGREEEKKKAMTEEERARLAAKLDEELNQFVESLEKRSYTEGWPEDRWEEEMEKHPFFMKKPPEEGDEVSPLIEGLQQLRYDPDDNTPEDLALKYKEDGNYSFKHKNYSMAILSYTEGIRQNCKDDKLTAELFNNRAASHFFLKNYRSCYNDCKKALALNPAYTKCKLRLIEACSQLNKYEEALRGCDDLIESDGLSQKVCDLLDRVRKRQGLYAREERKGEYRGRIQERNDKKLLEIIEKRGVKFLKGRGIEELRVTSEMVPNVIKEGVHLDGDRLVWPVILLYPEYKTTDIIQEFPEDTCFEDHLYEMFEAPPEWDEEKKYLPSNLAIYYEDVHGKIFEVPPKSTLLEIITRDSYYVDGGTPCFIVLPNGSKVQQHFLKNYN